VHKLEELTDPSEHLTEPANTLFTFTSLLRLSARRCAGIKPPARGGCRALCAAAA